MHNFEEQIKQWRKELTASHDLVPEKIVQLTEQLRENLAAVSDLDLSPTEKFVLAKYRLHAAENTDSSSAVDHKYGLGDLALMLGGYILFGLFFSMLQYIAIPLNMAIPITVMNGSMQGSPDLAYIVYTLSSALIIAAVVYGIWRSAQTDSIARLFGYRSPKPNSALTIAKNAVAIYLIIFVQQIISGYATHVLLMQGINISELNIDFSNRAMNFSGYSSLFLPTLLFISLMWIRHIKYPNLGSSADPTHA